MDSSQPLFGFLKLITYNQLDEIVIVTADDAFGMEIVVGAKKWAKILQLNVIDFISFREGRANLTEIAIKVASLKPKILICTGHY
ncbi:MAG: hypothetical protein GY705_28350 [Bacteroidetes bacterium]|nr:hypothetical protein [Bacteroidota bacterium]